MILKYSRHQSIRPVSGHATNPSFTACESFFTGYTKLFTDITGSDRLSNKLD
jgi:hypothetical protein